MPCVKACFIVIVFDVDSMYGDVRYDLVFTYSLGRIMLSIIVVYSLSMVFS